MQQAEGEDELKKRQLMELAIINGTYRDSSTKIAATGKCVFRIFSQGKKPSNQQFHSEIQLNKKKPRRSKRDGCCARVPQK